MIHFTPRILVSLLVFVLIPTRANAAAESAPATTRPNGPSGMAWIPAGEFSMGTDDRKSMPNEQPAHRVKLDAFWMDETPVTNAQFRRFVEATRYVTIAERPIDWEELKKQVA